MSEKNQKHDDILKLARERFTLVEEVERESRLKSLDDLNFLAGDQWPASVLAERKVESRPSLVINKLPQFARQIKNDQKQNRPALKVHPTDDKGTLETAKILQGIARHIEYSSNASTAYDTAFDGAVDAGIGYYRVVTDYVSPLSFNQEIRFKKIDNAFTVYKDPFSVELDGSDMNFCQVIEKMSPDEFKNSWPKAEANKMDDWASEADDWITKEFVRVAEYFYKEYTEVNIVQLTNGEVMEESEVEKYITTWQPTQPNEMPPDIKGTRTTQKCEIKWIIHNGHEVLDESVWMGDWIPIVPVYGVRLNVDGKIITEGIIRHAKDSQRMYNYFASNETEAIALAPKAPYIIAEGQLEGYEGIWAQANRASLAYLPYRAVAINGTVVGAPQRNSYEAATQAITQARSLASEDIKATTGIYDSSLGARSNETSGVAIRGRLQQAQTSNFHFADNLACSIRHGGRIVVNLIPKVYDTPQAIRILSDEDEQEVIRINEMFNRNGENVEYKLDLGAYDVTVDTGPSYQTKRQESAEFMMDFAKTIPSQASMISDLILKNLDVPGASDMAERLKKMLPPNLLDDKKQGDIPPQIKAQLDQSHQMIEQLTEALKKKTEETEGKVLELESRERIEFKKLENALVLKQLDLQGAAANALFAAELASIRDRLSLVDMGSPVGHEQEPQQPPQNQNQNQNFNESVPQGNAIQNEQPTGGFSPGQSQEF